MVDLVLKTKFNIIGYCNSKPNFVNPYNLFTIRERKIFHPHYQPSSNRPLIEQFGPLITQTPKRKVKLDDAKIMI